MFMIQKLAYFKKQMPENMCSPMTRIIMANQYVYPCLYRKNHIAPIIFSHISLTCCLKVPTVKYNQCCFTSTKTMTSVLCLLLLSMILLEP